MFAACLLSSSVVGSSAGRLIIRWQTVCLCLVIKSSGLTVNAGLEIGGQERYHTKNG